MRSKELSMEVKQEIISLRKKKKSIREISVMLEVAKSTVSNILVKKERTGELENSKRPGRPRKTTLVDDHRILSMLEKNPFTTSTQVKYNLQEVGASVSKTTINRRLRESKYCKLSGKFEEPQSQAKSLVKEEEQDLMEGESTPDRYQKNAQKAERYNKDLARPSLVATPPSPREGTSSAAALITTVSPATAPATTAAVRATTYPNRPTGTSATCGQNEEARQLIDRQLHREALSLIRRLNGDDEYDYFGYEIASSCRQMRPDRQEDFMSYIHAVTSVFRSNQPLPDIEDMICHVQWVAGLRPAPPPSLSRPEATSSTTQTDFHQ
ncbi:uncharacterized protein LOC122921753 isoform X2 [Bufo gargarizans]|uniref:uncharacterized protein LOC122921753 isoform X2 n=1 Tax=Bufo gargarizans TaxID=30331 RepID=UPI001CF3F880|nr:uncharacterized protein LOC122921753 isoform X2 [Bufo gargarizans]